MAYQVLARKWRPQDFAGVVGQEPVVTALRNGLTEGRIAQAYLFSGIRGVGKTSVARILAKALNCERGPTAEPCNACATCRQITEGSDLDVREVDAATYSKVEQVRDLTDSLKYGPARDRYKVVIIDEIHRLSRQAFDALLKIVEEPPPHVVFVFATTEAESVPATILSRCQEYRFRRVPSPALARHLAEIARAERIQVSEAALRLVARAGDGSVRDAVALLDQLATYGGSAVPDEEAARLLGGVDHALFHRLLEAILTGDAPVVSALVAEIEALGWDPRHVYTEFLAYCRDALHLALGAEETDLPAEEASRLCETAAAAGYENVLRVLHQLLASESAVRHSESGSLALEIAWLRAAELPKLTAIEEILSGGGGGAKRPRTGPAGPARRAAPSSRSRRASAASAPVADETVDGGPAADDLPPPGGETEGAAPSSMRSRDGDAPAPVPPRAASSQAPPPDDPATGHDGNGASPPLAARQAPLGPVERFLEEVSCKRQMLAAHLREATRLEFLDGVLEIHAPPDDDWLSRERLERPSARKALDAALAAVWGEDARWKLVASDAARAAPATPPPAASDAGIEEVMNDPRVQTVLDIFGGSVESVVDNEPLGDR